MAFQSTVARTFTLGRVGEVMYDGPSRVKTWTLNNQTALANRVGYAFTRIGDGVAVVGGTGAFAGILVSPKELTSYGTAAGGPLAQSLDVPANSNVELMDMGIVVVDVPVATAYGDPVFYVQADGSLHNATAAGRTQIPNARFVHETSAAGLSVIQLTQ